MAYSNADGIILGHEQALRKLQSANDSLQGLRFVEFVVRPGVLGEYTLGPACTLGNLSKPPQLVSRILVQSYKSYR